MKRIIINADDFGKSLERNRAIEYSFKNNLIDTASLIVTGKHLNNAIEIIKKGDYFKRVHLHFNITTNLIEEDPGDIPITEAMQKDPIFCKNGHFHQNRSLLSFFNIKKWKIIYNEIDAQYKKFIEITEGKADYKRVEFHMWMNLSIPASIALNLFTRKHKIESVRYYSIDKKNNKKVMLCRLLSWNHSVKYIPSINIDYYLSKTELFSNTPLMELYCHPNYKNGVFLDDSPSYLGHERQPMLKHIDLLNELKKENSN